MANRLTNEQKQQLITEMQKVNTLTPELKYKEIFERAVTTLGLSITINLSSAIEYARKAGLRPPKEGGSSSRSTPSTELAPEVAIQQHEKAIQEQVRKLVARRDELQNQVLHLDNLIAKYKAVR